MSGIEGDETSHFLWAHVTFSREIAIDSRSCMKEALWEFEGFCW